MLFQEVLTMVRKFVIPTSSRSSVSLLQTQASTYFTVGTAPELTFYISSFSSEVYCDWQGLDIASIKRSQYFHCHNYPHYRHRHLRCY